MKKLKNLSILLVALFAIQSIQAQDNPASDQQEKVKMIVIKKTIDEDGNETVEKIVKEGNDAKSFVWIEETDEDGEEKDVRIMIKEDDDELEFFDQDIEIEIEEEEAEKHIVIKKGEAKTIIEVEEKGGEKTIEIVEEDGDEVEVQVITLEEGEDIPEDVRKKLEELGIKLDEIQHHGQHGHTKKKKMKSKKKVKIIKKEKKAY